MTTVASFKSGNLTTFPACRYGFLERKEKAMSFANTELSTGTRKSIASKKRLQSVKWGRSVVAWDSLEPTSIADLWTTLVPKYQSINYGPLTFSVIWDPGVGAKIGKINPKRLLNRFAAYIIEGELERCRTKLFDQRHAAIRFGNLKPGFGYKGKRGDFCLIGGALNKTHATVYYRSLELIGGFSYDLALLAVIEGRLGCNWKSVTFVTANAFTFALKGNSNEKLYPKLVKIFKR